mmetsp:Transcript_15822/g.41655  ORF Transcript_15822/g.41655 Transcript_15822/m.41655 type:complete len:247 (-) Transcript_15822:229-969(-)
MSPTTCHASPPAGQCTCSCACAVEPPSSWLWLGSSHTLPSAWKCTCACSCVGARRSRSPSSIAMYGVASLGPSPVGGFGTHHSMVITIASAERDWSVARLVMRPRTILSALSREAAIKPSSLVAQATTISQSSLSAAADEAASTWTISASASTHSSFSPSSCCTLSFESSFAIASDLPPPPSGAPAAFAAASYDATLLLSRPRKNSIVRPGLTCHSLNTLSIIWPSVGLRRTYKSESTKTHTTLWP